MKLPGEGEHKIMDYIRYLRSQPDHDPNTRHCMYGLDADLIMLGLSSHEPHFSLLREEVRFSRPKDKEKKITKSVNAETITFHLLHLSLLRDYLEHEFSSLKSKLKFKFNLENIIDDWILMGFLVGNDFIPNLPSFHINKNALTKLYEVYMSVLPSLDGYLNEDGILNLGRFEKYLNKLAEIDYENFSEIYADLKYFESKTGRKMKDARRDKELQPFFEPGAEVPGDCLENDQNNKNEEMPTEVFLLSEEDEEEEDSGEGSVEMTEEEMFEEEFRVHKKDYYETKLKYPEANQSVFKEQAYCYVRAIQWNLHYYYNGCVSWSWYYPHHYAPYISDIKGFTDMDLNFDLGEPFHPYEQLLAVLPAASKQLLPTAFQRLVDDANSPLIEYYPQDFELDLNGKQQSWEAVVLIPFIDEKQLLGAARSRSGQLSKRERKNNTHGPHYLFKHSFDPVEPFTPPDPQYPIIDNNHADVSKVDVNIFSVAHKSDKKGTL